MITNRGKAMRCSDKSTIEGTKKKSALNYHRSRREFLGSERFFLVQYSKNNSQFTEETGLTTTMSEQHEGDRHKYENINHNIQTAYSKENKDEELIKGHNSMVQHNTAITWTYLNISHAFFVLTTRIIKAV